MKKLLIKVCGITTLKQAQELSKIGIDFLGFIFYDKSKRFVKNNSFILSINNIKKIGVFVNEAEENIITISTYLKLDYLQLHGNESIELCKKLKSLNFKIIKAISINVDIDLQTEINKFENYIDYFLFDTKTENYGGSGIKFSWNILNNIKIKKNFFLSGGIDSNDYNLINNFKNSNNNLPFMAIDINSKFEIEPGIKDINLIKEFINKIN